MDGFNPSLQTHFSLDKVRGSHEMFANATIFDYRPVIMHKPKHKLSNKSNSCVILVKEDPHKPRLSVLNRQDIHGLLLSGSDLAALRDDMPTVIKH